MGISSHRNFITPNVLAAVIYVNFNTSNKWCNMSYWSYSMRQHPTGPKRKESQGDWKSTRKYAELPSEEDCPPGGESSEVDPSSEGLSPNEIISKYIKKICWLQLLYHRLWEI